MITPGSITAAMGQECTHLRCGPLVTSRGRRSRHTREPGAGAAAVMQAYLADQRRLAHGGADHTGVSRADSYARVEKMPLV